MIKYTSQNQLSFEGFDTTFENQLDPNNRWVKLAVLIPWDDLAMSYYKLMDSGMGAPSKDARLIIGSLIIKHKMKLADEEVIEQLKENIYMQYFVGYSSFQKKQAFAPSLFVEIRKRLGQATFDAFTDSIIERVEDLKQTKSGKTKPDKEEDQNGEDQGEEPQNKGKLIIDATVAPQDIKYPTDLNLLNQSREKSEELIDKLWAIQGKKGVKPRTYRRQARQDYLELSRKKRKSKKSIRQGIRKQLNYVQRNFGHIERLLDQVGMRFLDFKDIKYYWIIQQVYRQQRQMYQSKTNKCEDRIVSIHQPHVRPMVRGKDRVKVEFGAQIGVALFDGLVSVDHISWHAYHEGVDLQTHVENYRKRHGHYPECVLADRKYGTRQNRKWLQSKDIRFGGRPLGRPPKEEKEKKQRRRQQRQDEIQRIPIEGKFGQGKRAYGMDCIKAKTKSTSESWINAVFFVLNLTRMAKDFAVWMLPILLFLADFLLCLSKTSRFRRLMPY